MKLLRYGPRGQKKPGLLDRATLPVVAGQRRLGVPVAGIRKFIAVGLNYADHAAEAGLPVPQEPVLFAKAISCLNGPNDEVMLPKGSRKSDWEVELGVVIGTCSSGSTSTADVVRPTMPAR